MKRFASVHVILTITFYEEKEIYRVEKNKNITSHRLLVKSQYSLFYLILKKATTTTKKKTISDTQAFQTSYLYN